MPDGHRTGPSRQPSLPSLAAPVRLKRFPPSAGQAPISLDIAPSLPYLVAIITEKANLVKARDAKARVFVRPTKGGMVQGDGKADPHKIAALP